MSVSGETFVQPVDDALWAKGYVVIIDNNEQYHAVNSEYTDITSSNSCMEVEIIGDIVTFVSNGNHENIVISPRIRGITVEITSSFNKGIYTIFVEDLADFPASKTMSSISMRIGSNRLP